MFKKKDDESSKEDNYGQDTAEGTAGRDEEQPMTMERARQMLPPLRLFQLTRKGPDFDSLPRKERIEGVEAHSVDPTPDGGLVFYELVIVQDAQGVYPIRRYRRALAAGEWAEYTEIVMPVVPAPQGRIIH